MENNFLSLWSSKANEFLQRVTDEEEAEVRKLIERDGPKKVFADAANKLEVLLVESFDEYQKVKDTLCEQERKAREVELLRLAREYTSCRLAAEAGEKFEALDNSEVSVN